MALNELLSTSFLFSVAIVIILIGGIFAYVSYRMSEQDHKITSMVGLISTMAEELQFFRSKLSQSQSQSQDQVQQGGLQEQPVTDQRHTLPVLDPNNLITGATSLIPVSDDEDESDEDEDEDEETASEDDDEDEDEDNESESESEDEDDEYDLDEIVDLEGSVQIEEPMQIKDPMQISMDEKITETNHSDIKSIHLEEPIELNVFNHEHSDNLEHDHELEHVEDLLASDLKTISITDLEDTNKKTDYKKMSITKLREVVIEKGIVADATKLKKNEILKLLGDE